VSCDDTAREDGPTDYRNDPVRLGHDLDILRKALERIAESRTSDRIRYDNDLRVSHDSNIKEAQDALLLAGKGE